MNRWTGTFIAMLACALLAVVVFFALDFSANRSFSSPNEVFDSIRLASQKDDMRGWLQCLTDESRDLVVADAILKFSSDLRKKPGADESKAVEQLFAKNGLTEEFLTKMMRGAAVLNHPEAPPDQKLAFVRALLAPINDPTSFVVDLLKTTKKSSESQLAIWKDAKLTEVQVVGKAAQGIVTLRGQEQPMPIFFLKQGDSWRIDLFPAEEKRPSGLPPGHP